MTDEQFAALRQYMVTEITAHVVLVGERIGKYNLDKRVMEAMGRVPRHRFVPSELQPYAYLNQPLPIGFEKTISQPFIVALMTDLLEPHPEDRVLEIGTGMGYQAAVLAELVHTVYSVEFIEPLAAEGARRLRKAGYRNIELRTGNGYRGWPEQAPFDKIIVTAAPDLIPTGLLHQLKPGGRMVIPAGLSDSQQLMLVEKREDATLATREIIPVRFSQLEGESV